MAFEIALRCYTTHGSISSDCRALRRRTRGSRGCGNPFNFMARSARRSVDKSLRTCVPFIPLHLQISNIHFGNWIFCDEGIDSIEKGRLREPSCFIYLYLAVPHSGFSIQAQPEGSPRSRSFFTLWGQEELSFVAKKNEPYCQPLL